MKVVREAESELFVQDNTKKRTIHSGVVHLSV